MRSIAMCILSLAALIASAHGAATATSGKGTSEPARSLLEGDWETVIQSPRRPWAFVIHFKRAQTGWVGAMTFPGFSDFPLSEVRAETTWVHFRFPPELESLVFDGDLQGEAIIGRVSEGDQPIPAQLTRAIELPSPGNRLEAWRQDLDFAVTHLYEYDRSFSAEARVDFLRSMAALNLNLPHDDDDQILAALSRAVALSGNAHTRVRLAPTRYGDFTTEFPIRIWWFQDGPWVVEAAPAFGRAVRCRVIAIEGHAVSDARREVMQLFAGNQGWADYLTPIYFTCPDLMHGLGLIRSPKAASWTFEDSAGTRFDLRIRATRINGQAAPTESWQDLSPVAMTGNRQWPAALAPMTKRLPLYLQHPERAYWFTHVRESGLLYFQFNRSESDAVGQSFEAFADSLIAFGRSTPVRTVVVDLRFNSGGNLVVARGFFERLAREEWANLPGRLFVIVGRCTFSAGLYHAAQLKELTQAVFVGEPVGDRLDFWAEGGQIVLPNSGVAIWYSNGFHRYSQADYPEYRPYFEQLSVPALALGITAALSSEDYFAGRDPALEAILSRLPQ
jgi:hypothetical protein